VYDRKSSGCPLWVENGHGVGLFEAMPMSPSDDEPSYFAYSATLRIHGTDLPLEGITLTLGVAPSHTHKAGHRVRPAARPYNDDAWHFTAPVAEEVELTEHLRCLWRTVEPNVDYLLELNAEIDVFCGYRSNNGAAGFAVDPDALQIFTALNVPFCVSVVVDSWLGERLSQVTEH
jgi:hypothetical protein